LIPRLLSPSANYKGLAMQGHDENLNELLRKREEK
jgi:hypothetical protein